MQRQHFIKRRVLACWLAAGSLFMADTAFTGSPGGGLPDGWQASHVRPISHLYLEGPRAFKLGIKPLNGRWYLFIADGLGSERPAERPDLGIRVIDVTDPARPKLAASVAVPHGDGQLTLNGNLLIAGQQGRFPTPGASSQSVDFNEMATLFDISDPVHPRRLSAWTTDGWGTHRNGYPGGKYAFMSSFLRGYRNDTILVILDVSDPMAPREAGRWSRPGAREDEPAPATRLGFHGPAFLQPDGKTLTIGATPGVVNLDISDPARPRVIGDLVFSPLPDLGQQTIHTVVPLPGGMLHVNGEPYAQGCEHETPALAAIVDNRDLARPRLISHYPRPSPPPGASYRSFCDKEGRFGPHNVNSEFHEEGVQQPGSLVYMTYFNAGLRVFDVSDPYAPREVGWFLPRIGAWKDGARGLEDVLVDTRGYIYTSSGPDHGLWILRYEGRRPVP